MSIEGEEIQFAFNNWKTGICKCRQDGCRTERQKEARPVVCFVGGMVAQQLGASQRSFFGRWVCIGRRARSPDKVVRKFKEMRPPTTIKIGAVIYIINRTGRKALKL